MIFNEQPKSQPISRLQVNEAFKRVKANKGAPGQGKRIIIEKQHGY